MSSPSPSLQGHTLAAVTPLRTHLSIESRKPDKTVEKRGETQPHEQVLVRSASQWGGTLVLVQAPAVKAIFTFLVSNAGFIITALAPVLCTQLLG